MLILALDTSTRSGSIAVLRDAAPLGTADIGADEPYSASIPRNVNTLLSSLCTTLNQIDLFAVSAGPGSFTGLRVGLTAAKAWSEVFGKPIAAISALEAVAALGFALPNLSETAAEVVAPVIDAHRGQVFGGLYRRRAPGGRDDLPQLEADGDEVVASIEEFIELVRERARGSFPVFASSTPRVIQPELDRSAFSSARVQEVSPVLAPAIGRLGYAKALRGELTDSLRLDANYVRRPDAEVNWKGE